ncbi:MAG: hypothetical protein ACP5QU_01970 [Anaerolineae bacterium]
MNTEKVYLVILIVIGIVVLSNLMMYAMVRGSRNIRWPGIHSLGDTFNPASKDSEKTLQELRQRVNDLSQRDDDDPDER